MKLNNIVDVIKKNSNGVIFSLKKYSPEIMIVAGAIGTVTAAVMACRATMHVNDVLDENADNLNAIRDLHVNEQIDDKTFKSEMTKAYIHTGLEFATLYGPSVVLGALSMGTVFASNEILRKRNASITAAYATVDGAFKRYRKNVVDRYGKDTDKSLRFGTDKQQIEVVETSKDGKEKKVKKTVDVASIDPNQYSEYARYFDKENPEWEKSDEYNLMFLKSQQNYANDLLKSKKYLFLNDVYDMLGFPRTQAGQFVGWFYDEENPVGDNFVDFNLTDCYRAVSGGNPEKTILLDFNVDGNIIDKI